jgi:hypothetical protein
MMYILVQFYKQNKFNQQFTAAYKAARRAPNSANGVVKIAILQNLKLYDLASLVWFINTRARDTRACTPSGSAMERKVFKNVSRMGCARSKHTFLEFCSATRHKAENVYYPSLISV